MPTYTKSRASNKTEHIAILTRFFTKNIAILPSYFRAIYQIPMHGTELFLIPNF